MISNLNKHNKIGVRVNTLRRKNFLPTLVVILLLILTILNLVYFTSPDNFLVIFIFFLLLFALFLFTFSLVIGNAKKGFIVSLVLIIFLILRILGVGNIINFVLLTGLGIIALVYENIKK
jgi:uncharacterized membrane protein YfhO